MRNIFIYLIILTILPTTFASAQSVDLLWQGETYTPPFYKGQSLWTKQSSITFLAIPQGVSSSGLSYKWTRNGTVLGSLSGVGKNALTFSDTVLSRAQTVKVDILSSDSVIASASVTVAPTDPYISIYENNPLYGLMFHREIISRDDLVGNEVSYSAFPMFFSIGSRLGKEVGYEWSTNSGNKESNNSVTYRVPEGSSGSSQVSIRAFNKNFFLQDVSRSFVVKFGENDQ